MNAAKEKAKALNAAKEKANALNAAKEKANALKDATAYAVRDWPKNKRRIPKEPGIYMFSGPEGRRMYVGSAIGKGGIRKRLGHQVYPKRIGTPWTLSNPPGKTVLNGRNLLGNVLKELSDKRFKEIKRGSEKDMDALNRAFECIHEMTVQWVECPDWNTAIRAEHCAICQYGPEYVEK